MDAIRKAITKAILGGKPGGPWEGGIRAYHSSPHDFDKVDFSKLRTGEGANVYGAGHYMAENPAVSGQGGQYWQQFQQRFENNTPEGLASKRLWAAQFDRDKAIEAAARDVKELSEYITSPKATRVQQGWHEIQGGDDYYKKLLASRQQEYDLLTSGKPVGPRTYEMNLRAKPEELLDWDKPLAAQPDILSKITGSKNFNYVLSEMPAPGTSDFSRFPTDKFMHRARKDMGDVEASHALANAGIPGIRYLDEGSRISSPDQIKAIRENIAHREALLADRPGDPTNTKWLAEYRDMLKRAENPTYNYVGTDPSKLDILAKYGVAGAAPIGMGASYAQDRYEVPR